MNAANLPADMAAALRPESVGARLGLIRQALDLSPSQIADTLGIERTYWSRFENGRRVCTEQVAAMLVSRFGVTLDFIYLGRWDRLPLDLAEKMRKVASD